MAKRLMPILVLIGFMWLVFVVNQLLLGGHLVRFGIVPRQLGGLPGIVFAPFLHLSLQHIVANTLPLFILGAIVCLRSRNEYYRVLAIGIFVGGLLTWIIARKATHVGASGLIFCFFGYLASLAWFRRTLGSLALSLVCLLLYGGMVSGILPARGGISWEGHAAGLLAGILAASMAPRATQNPSSPFAVPVETRK